MQNATVPSDSLAPHFRVSRPTENDNNESLLRYVSGNRHSNKKWWWFVTCCVLLLLAGGVGAGAYYLRGVGRAAGHPELKQCAPASLTLVQSIPVGDFNITQVAGAIPTHEALVQLADWEDLLRGLRWEYINNYIVIHIFKCVHTIAF